MTDKFGMPEVDCRPAFEVITELRDTIAQQAELLAAHKAEMQDWQRALLAAQQENAEYRAALERIASCHVEQGMSMQQHATNALAKHSPEDDIERARRKT